MAICTQGTLLVRTSPSQLATMSDTVSTKAVLAVSTCTNIVP